MIHINGILIVGAMAVSPDILPITAIAIALVARRGRLAGRAALTLAACLACAGVTAGLVTAVLDLADLLPPGFVLTAR